MTDKEIAYEITWDEITDRPKSGNYQLFHYGELEFNEGTFPFTLAEMYDDNIGYTSFEITWVEGYPNGDKVFSTDRIVSELENAIIDSLDDERWKAEQEEIEEHKRLKDIDDENAWNGIK